MTAAPKLGTSLGVMQGRLSPMIFGGYQAFPTDLWQQEFVLAHDRDVDHIEWVVDSPSVPHNPILIDPERVRRQSDETGTRVVSVCADFLMDDPLDVDIPSTWAPFDQLLDAMATVGARYLIIPCVDQSSLDDPVSRARLIRALREVEGRLADGSVQVALETDLPPIPFRQLLDELDPTQFGVNYDIGNSASLGFDPAEEFENYGPRVNLLHVKDRQLHGGSVLLGTGSADVAGVLANLRELQFDGPVTMQCFRDHEGLAVFDEQLATYRSMVEVLFHGP